MNVWLRVLLGLSLGLSAAAGALAETVAEPQGEVVQPDGDVPQPGGQGVKLDHEVLQRRYGDADMVSLVKVKFIGDLVNPAMSVHGLIAVQGYVYTAELLQQWKGVERPNFKIRVNLSDCHARLSLDSEYVVFGKLSKDYDFQSFSCDDFVPREKALELLGALDKVRDRQLAKNPKKIPPSI